MNILIINWRDMKNPLYGGAELHITKIAENLAKKHNVLFLTSGYRGAEDNSVNGVRYMHIGGELTFNFSVYGGIKRIAGDFKADLIIEDINKVPFFTPLFTDIPVLVVIPHIFGDTIFSQAPFPAALYVYLAEKPIPRVYRDSCFEVISKSTKDDLVGRGIPSDRIMVAECGVDSVDYPDEAKSPSPLIVYVGRLKKYKSVDHIISAMPEIIRRIPDARLMIVGTGDHRPELEKLAGSLNLKDRVRFTGYVSEEKKFRILKEAWVSVYPSLIEGWGIVNIEANSLRTPVVCANVPGLRDSVKDGYSGLLYEYGNTQDLASKIESMLSDKARYDAFCDNALQWSRNFTWERTVSLTDEFIKKLFSKSI